MSNCKREMKILGLLRHILYSEMVQNKRQKLSLLLSYCSHIDVWLQVTQNMKSFLKQFCQIQEPLIKVRFLSYAFIFFLQIQTDFQGHIRLKTLT